jgi:UDP-N-acetylmuramoyl-L-alanyl-D-glutamate--2,6-diaminopimelate ligase
MARAKQLHDLLTAAGLSPAGVRNATITGLSYDSRTVRSGDLYFAVKGKHADGHRFLPQAAQKGAAAAIVEDAAGAPLPCVATTEILPAMASIAAAFFDHPSRRLPVVGNTGTNGKTTTTYVLENILRAAGKTCGVLGTVNYRIGTDLRDAPNTTPMSADVQSFFAELIDKKIDVGVMEVSSHALALHRVDHVSFAVAVFSNLTQDHLDFHGDMEGYFKAKARLFESSGPLARVTNVDDAYGARLLKMHDGAVGYGFDERAAIRAENAVYDLTGIRFTLRLPSGKTTPVRSRLMGKHNIYNLLAGAGAALGLGLSEDLVVAGLGVDHVVPGRLERVDAGQKFVVVVDYAHTPDALEQVLKTLKDTGPRRLISVFGAGGDRDKTKRPLMGKVSTRIADHSFLTSDNPRSEDPDAILRDIEAGINAEGRTNFTTITDRDAAIKAALSSAGPGDIVLIAGKGHETYQIYGQTKVHFSDQETALKYLRS